MALKKEHVHINVLKETDASLQWKLVQKLPVVNIFLQHADCWPGHTLRHFDSTSFLKYKRRVCC